MEKHAVPQNIMDVEFKLFGSLTVKQFSYVAISFLTALFFYIIPLPGLLKVIFIIITVGLGLAFSFVTVNGLPFTTWFGNFTSNLFASQRKVYKKTPLPPKVLSDIKITAKRGINVGKAKDVEDNNYLQALLERNRDKKDEQVARDETVELTSITDQKVDDPFANDKASALDKYFANAAVQSFAKNGEMPARIDPTQNLQNTQVTKPNENEPKVQVINELQANQIAGFVVDKSGKVISSATVTITNSGDSQQVSVYTDDRGKFILPKALANGTYQIAIQSEGYVFPEFTLQLTGELIPLYKYMALNGK